MSDPHAHHHEHGHHHHHAKADDTLVEVSTPEELTSALEKELQDRRSHRELADCVATALGRYLANVRDCELFLANTATGEFTPARKSGPGLLASLFEACRRAEQPAGSALLLPQLLPSDRALDRGSMMSAPIVSGAALLGVLVLERPLGGEEFQMTDLRTLASVAETVSRVLPAVQLKMLSASAKWLQNDMSSAREVQRQLLPMLEKNYGGVRVAAEYHPSFAVGGDFYDLVDLGGGHLIGMIGDASGKGVAAALMMSRVSSELHQLGSQGMGPGEMLTRVNGSLQERTRDDRFVTVVCVQLDVSARRWVVANAGHVAPHLRRKNGAVLPLAYASGPPLGMVPGHTYSDEVFEAAEGDVLVMVTDGVLEVLEGPRDECSTIGTCRLTDLIADARHDLGDIRRSILAAVAATAAGARDDVAFLGLQIGE